MARSIRNNGLALLVVSAAAIALAGCSRAPARARDVAGDRRGPTAPNGAADDGGTSAVVPEPPRASEPASVRADRPRVLTKASARALASSATHLYYGDSEDDGIYSIAKAGGAPPLRIARHAPVSGAIALDGGFVTWVASPGDAVLRAPISGGVEPTTLRDGGIFSDVATTEEDVLITEAIGSGGALIRVTGATATRLATFDGPPRAVMAEKAHAFIVTPTRIFRTPHQRGELATIATGARFSYANLDEAFIYVVTEVDKDRALVRFPKAGGSMAIVARDVRDAPIKIDGGEVFFFDATRPQIRSVPANGGPSRVVAEDEGLATVSAIEVDASTVYVAEGAHESGVIVAIARR
jgi:hypothetical protein